VPKALSEMLVSLTSKWDAGNFLTPDSLDFI
jgi:hypothetical protein